MIPFLWIGYYLRFVINKVNWTIAFSLIISYSILYYFWNNTYSIYISPFHIWTIDAHSINALFFRFLIGGVGGIAIISLSRLLIDRKGFQWMIFVAQFGRYTLVFYTMSFVLNAILARVMWHFDSYVTMPGLLDVLAFLISAIMMILMYYFQVVIEKNFVLSRLFLGK